MFNTKKLFLIIPNTSESCQCTLNTLVAMNVIKYKDANFRHLHGRKIRCMTIHQTGNVTMTLVFKHRHYRRYILTVITFMHNEYWIDHVTLWHDHQGHESCKIPYHCRPTYGIIQTVGKILNKYRSSRRLFRCINRYGYPIPSSPCTILYYSV